MIPAEHLHPLSVHFPIGFLLLGFVAELLSMRHKENKFYMESAMYLMLLGSMASVVAYLTGEFLTEEMSGKAGDVRDIHSLFANITTFGSLVASGLYLYYSHSKTTVMRWIVFVAYSLVALSVAVTGYLGGSLVYDHMILR